MDTNKKFSNPRFNLIIELRKYGLIVRRTCPLTNGQLESVLQAAKGPATKSKGDCPWQKPD